LIWRRVWKSTATADESMPVHRSKSSSKTCSGAGNHKQS
jgi:hypothetical protein